MATKIVAIGERDSILPFKVIGVEIFPVRDIQNARETLTDLITQAEIGIILLQTDFAEKLTDVLESVKEKTLPSILLIPGSRGRTDFAFKRTRELVKRAVGVDILKSEE